MAPILLSFEQRIEAFVEENAEVSELIEPYGTRSVPSCPDWTLSDLVVHLIKVLRRWEKRVLDPDVTDRVDIDPIGDVSPHGLCDALDEVTDDMARALYEKGPDAQCWNFSGSDFVTGWLARRLAAECAIHRVDAELSYTSPAPVKTDRAADGLDERLTVFLPAVMADRRKGDLGGSLCLSCNDVDLSYVVEARDGRWNCREGRGPVDCVIEGPVSDLFLFSWGRPPQTALAMSGDIAVAAAWDTLPG